MELLYARFEDSALHPGDHRVLSEHNRAMARAQLRALARRRKRVHARRLAWTALLVCFVATLWFWQGAHASMLIHRAALMPVPTPGPVYAPAPAGSRVAPIVAPQPLPAPHALPRASWDRSIHAHPAKGRFRRFFRMRATAYTPINTRMEGGRFTVTRRDGRVVHGVAVDPDLIPLGSRLWIPGYGHAVADDIGGRIQGHRVDVRVQRRRNMSVWGVRQLRVYVLDDPQSGS